MVLRVSSRLALRVEAWHPAMLGMAGLIGFRRRRA
jgi:hypothetical protein